MNARPLLTPWASRVAFVSAFFILSAIYSCTNPKPASRTISPQSDSIRYMGRIKHEKDSSTVYWSGSAISVRFKGRSLQALLRDEHGKNYFNIVIDGDSLRYFSPSPEKRYYTLAENLGDGEHVVDLIKRNEWETGKTWFYGLKIHEGTLLTPPAPRKRVIEFFGNSITAGYAIEDYTGGDSPDSIFTNNYYTYAALTARHFNADYYCTVKSGIGIMVSWFPLIMPEIYDRLDPTDSSSRWDFKRAVPDIVVINLLQNDSWLVNLPTHESFKQRFGTKPPSSTEIIAAYKSFVEKVRNVYPGAHIICALGSMDAMKEGSPWPTYVQQAVAELRDEKIYTHFFPYIKKPGHPRKEDNAIMAKSLIEFIERRIKW
ncbi:MAG: SGNH/GDSL hydrolase family protein [Bacteroidota bacterium]